MAAGAARISRSLPRAAPNARQATNMPPMATVGSNSAMGKMTKFSSVEPGVASGVLIDAVTEAVATPRTAATSTPIVGLRNHQRARSFPVSGGSTVVCCCCELTP